MLSVFKEDSGMYSFGRVFAGLVILTGLSHGVYSGAFQWEGMALLSGAVYGLSKVNDTIAEFAHPTP